MAGTDVRLVNAENSRTVRRKRVDMRTGTLRISRATAPRPRQKCQYQEEEMTL